MNKFSKNEKHNGHFPPKNMQFIGIGSVSADMKKKIIGNLSDWPI